MLTVPDIQNITNGTNGFDFQTIWDQQDLAVLGTGQTTGVYYGCNVVPLATPGYSASVDPGLVAINGSVPITVAGGSVTVAAADATDRRDIIVANSGGGIGIVKGTDCGTAGWLRTNTTALAPVKPSFGGSVMLSEIAVPGGAASVTAMNASCMVDKRVMVIPSVLAEVNYNQTTTYTITSATMAAIDSTNLTMTFVAPPSGKVRLRWTAVMGISSASDYISVGWFAHAGGLFAGSHIWTSIGWAATKPLPITHEQIVTGLSYGTSYSIDLAWGTNAGTATMYTVAITSTTASNTNGGPAHLIVEAA